MFRFNVSFLNLFVSLIPIHHFRFSLYKCLNITILATRKIILFSLPSLVPFFFEPHFTNIFHRSTIISNEKLSRMKNYLERFFFVSLPRLSFQSWIKLEEEIYMHRAFPPAPQFRVNFNPYLLIAHIVQWISITSANYLIGRFSWPRISPSFLVITFHYENCHYYIVLSTIFQIYIPFQ